jgi:hypothetical protein
MHGATIKIIYRHINGHSKSKETVTRYSVPSY